MLKTALTQTLWDRFHVKPEQASRRQFYLALLSIAQAETARRPRNAGPKKLYYVSAEFLIGKLLSNNLLSLGLYEEAEQFLAGFGHTLAEVEEEEDEPSLGNGGLGRLAACFLDSIAALGLPGDGVGLNYHEGLFRQAIRQRKQCEEPDPWISPASWLLPTGKRFPVAFGSCEVTAVLYDIAVPGCNGGRNALRLFDLETVNEDIIEDGISFDKTDVAHNLTLFLYPDDSDEEGRLLRLYQQYFLVSATAQLILEELRERGFAPEELDRHAVVQINDTHPSLLIPELIRLLGEEGVPLERAAAAVSRACAYTNHTILAEALEKWPLESIETVAPQLVPVIEALDRLAAQAHPAPEVRIIDEDGLVHMARMDIHYGFRVNGVAALHTEILKKKELRPFYEIYPEKFTNKTNGITFRRWLLCGNRPLAGWIEERIGPDFRKDADALERLLPFRGDEDSLLSLLELKRGAKRRLAERLLESQGAKLDPDAVFDIQAKRLHEYKRQLMNALYAVYLYLEIKEGRRPPRPVTVLFAAKAAPAYTLAKDVIHFILCLSALVERDPAARNWLKIVMVENYNVTKAGWLIPACEISEQISLASQEASGTGNMKFMLNGAVTLGTLDGANVEIAGRVGRENIALFGKSSAEVLRLYEQGAYDPDALLREDPDLARLADFILHGPLLRLGDPDSLFRLYRDLSHKDWFMTLLDLKDYIRAKDGLLRRYEDRLRWARMSLTNIAMAGYFSSDRTIREYDRDIWHLEEARR